jgi:hypothetical protein
MGCPVLNVCLLCPCRRVVTGVPSSAEPLPSEFEAKDLSPVLLVQLHVWCLLCCKPECSTFAICRGACTDGRSHTDWRQTYS